MIAPEPVFSPHLAVLLFEGRDIDHDRGGFEGERFLVPTVFAPILNRCLDTAGRPRLKPTG